MTSWPSFFSIVNEMSRRDWDPKQELHFLYLTARARLVTLLLCAFLSYSLIYYIRWGALPFFFFLLFLALLKSKMSRFTSNKRDFFLRDVPLTSYFLMWGPPYLLIKLTLLIDFAKLDQ